MTKILFVGKNIYYMMMDGNLVDARDTYNLSLSYCPEDLRPEIEETLSFIALQKQKL